MRKRLLFLILSLIIAVSCQRGSKKTFDGDWGPHAQNAWNVLVGALERHGIQVNKPSRLNTHFEPSHGTLGSGGDRFPYQNRNGGRVGGWHIGSCNGSANAYVVQESNGHWNMNIGTHEVGHHVNNHARCGKEKGQHPDYMKKAGVPHWPYWSGSYAEGDGPAVWLTPTHAEDGQGNYICVIFVDPAGTVLSLDTVNEREETAREILQHSLSEQRILEAQ